MYDENADTYDLPEDAPELHDEALDTLNAAMLHYDGHYAAQTAWKQPLMVSTEATLGPTPASTN